jgi:hypothetical protein
VVVEESSRGGFIELTAGTNSVEFGYEPLQGEIRNGGEASRSASAVLVKLLASCRESKLTVKDLAFEGG